MGMKKSLKRQIGIKELKARGFSYEQIGEKIREFKRLGYVPVAQTEPLGIFQPEENRKPVKKISIWQRVWIAISLCFEKLILRMKRG